MEKIDIKDILDLMNDVTNYKGKDNKGKNTNERDDVVSRQAVNKWIKEYNDNPLNTKKINKFNQNQFKTYYSKEDILRLIEYFEYNLITTYKRKTISKEDYIQSQIDNRERTLKAFGDHFELFNIDEIRENILSEIKENDLLDDSGNIALSLLDNKHEELTQKEIEEKIEQKKKEIVATLLDMESVENYARQLIIGEAVHHEDLRNDCIRK